MESEKLISRPPAPCRRQHYRTPGHGLIFGYEGTRDQLLQGGGRRVVQRINQFQFHFSLGQTF